MKIITWNVNSVRQRLERTLALLDRLEPDVLCLQETKTKDDAFPLAEIQARGYHCALNGQAGRNGVAIISRAPVEAMASFPGDPASEQARVISATVGGVRIVNIYAINGKFAGAPEYDLKLDWFEALADWIATEHTPDDEIVLTGDFNVAPDDRDVHDPDAWREQNLASSKERARLHALLGWGMKDLLRLHHEDTGPFTWWDYRAGAFHKGWGLRIDLVLGTAPVAARCTSVEVDRNERKPTSGEGKPSDHAPVIATLS